jgi:heptosyltransferase-2
MKNIVNKSGRSIDKLLVRLPNWVGDVVMATPTLRSLRESFPKTRIIALGKPWARELLRDHPCIDQIITHSFRNGSLRLISQLKALNADTALLFPNSFASALIFFLARIPNRIGYNTKGRGLLLTRGIRTPSSTVHQVDYFLGLMNGFDGVQNWDRSLYFPVSEEAMEEASAFWRTLGVSETDTLIGLNPGAAWGSSKRWLQSYFGETGDLFQERSGAKIAIFGGPEETPLAEEIAQLMKSKPIIVAGKDNLHLLPALLKRCNLFITNDTGPMHLAAAQKTPQIVLFGPTDPHQTAHEDPNIKVIRKELECSPCFKRECPYGHHNCMKSISATEVFRAGAELLNKSGMISPQKAQRTPS